MMNLLIALLIVAVPSTAGVPTEGYKEINSTLTAYYPDTFSDDESGMMDMKGNRLQTLQDFLDGRAPYVTVATDPQLQIPYGERIFIPSVDSHYGVRDGIRFEARDAGTHLEGSGWSRVDVCVRSEQDSYDKSVNRAASVLVPRQKIKRLLLIKSVFGGTSRFIAR